MYRATGQSHKPVPPTQVQKLSDNKQDAPITQFCKFINKHMQLYIFYISKQSKYWDLWCKLNCYDTDADRARKHGMDEFISADPCKYDHSSLYELLQRLTLDHRLNDSYSCLVGCAYLKKHYSGNNLKNDT